MRSGWFHLSKPERLTISSLIQIWRLLLVLAAAYPLGGLLGRLFLPWYDPFTNWWIGGTVGAPVGFLLGLWWQLASRHRRRCTRLDLVLFIGVLTCVVAPIYSLEGIRSEQHFQARLDAFRTLPADSVKRITCYDKYGREKLLTIENPEVLRAFAGACRDTKGYSPNHPRYLTTWYVVVELADTPEVERPLELECHFEQGRSDQLVGYFVNKHGNATSYHGSFISTNLRPWFERHVDHAQAAHTKTGRH